MFKQAKCNEKKIRACLTAPLDILCFDSIGSTNTEAARLLKEGRRAPFLITAEEQTAGRGRQGKRFYSPKRSGLYMTLVLPKSREFLAVTSAAAVAVCRAVEALTDKRPRIKWVNDIFLDGRKIGGILCENAEDAVIIGIGINLTTATFPAALPNAGALGAVDKSRLTAALVNHLRALQDADYADFIEDYRRRSLLIGKQICFTQNGVTKSAVVRGIDERCGLCVALTDGTEQTLRSGEITIKETAK